MEGRPEAGRVLGDHQLLRRLGSGGMGQVWEAVYRPSGARRAIKLLHLDGLDPAGVLRFAREMEAQAQVGDHPHMARVHSAGHEAGVPYLVLELVTGGDLNAYIAARGPLPAGEAARLVRDLTRGLAHAHARGVLHRDLKPENVLFDEQGRPKLIDFGLAWLAGATRLTRTGEVLGTPAWMAPEVVLGRPADARSDVYGLGALLYFALTGQAPFAGRLGPALLQQVAQQPPLPPRTLARDVPRQLEALCLRCLAKDPADRPPSAEALERELERALQPRPTRWSTGPLLLVLALLAAGLGLLLLGGERPRSAPGALARSTPADPPARQPAPISSRTSQATDTHARAPEVAPVAAPTSSSWAARIRAEAGRPAVRPDLLVIPARNDEARDRSQELARALQARDLRASQAALDRLRALAAEGSSRAQAELGAFLCDAEPEQRALLGLPRDPGPAHELLWQATRSPDARAYALLRLARLLLTGGPGLPAEPAALDALAWALPALSPAMDPSDRREWACLFLERGAPGDLLSGLEELKEMIARRRPLQGAPRARVLAALGVTLSPTIGYRLAAAVIVREGWDQTPSGDAPPRVAPGDQAWAEAELLELVREGSRGARGYLAASRRLGAPLPAGAQGLRLPAADPLDLVALDGGASVTRPADLSALVHLANGVEEAVASGDRARLESCADSGFSPGMWALARRLSPPAALDPREERCLVAGAGVTPGTCSEARAELGRVLFLGEWGRRAPALGVRYLTEVLPRLEGTEDWAILARTRAWLALARLLGEGTDRDERQAEAALRQLTPDLARELTREPGRAAWLHVALSDLNVAPLAPHELLELIERAAADGLSDALDRLRALAEQGEPAALAALERLGAGEAGRGR